MNSSEIMKYKFVEMLSRNDFRDFCRPSCEEIISQFAKALEEVYWIKASLEKSAFSAIKYFHISPRNRWQKTSIFSVNIDDGLLYFDKSCYCINDNTLPDILEKITKESFFKYVIKSCTQKEKEPSSITFCKKQTGEAYEIKNVISVETRNIIFPIKRTGNDVTFSFEAETEFVSSTNFFMPEIVIVENAELYVTDFLVATDSSSTSANKKITITAKILKIWGQND